MLKYIFFVTIFFASISYAASATTIDSSEVSPELSTKPFNNLQMLNDSLGNTFVFWVESIYEKGPYWPEIENQKLKFSYRPVGGDFSSPIIIDEGDLDFFRFSAAIDSSGNVIVVWSSDFTTYSYSYRPSGNESTFTDPQEAFDSSGEIGNIKVKAAPNGTFFAVVSLDNGYFWSQRLAGANTGFSNLVLIDEEILYGGGALDDFDFSFDSNSNVLLAWFEADLAGTTLSNVYYAFKPVSADFKAKQVILRQSDEYYVDHLNVNYNGSTSLGPTWTIFWEEATTSFINGTFYIRGQLLNNNGSNTNVAASTSPKVVYSITGRNTDQLRVYQRAKNQELAIWGEDTTSIKFSVFNPTKVLAGNSTNEFVVQSIEEAGINPIGMAVANQGGFSLISWNTRGQAGGNIRWGYISDSSDIFNYVGSLQSSLTWVKPFSVYPRIGFTGKKPILTWIGGNKTGYRTFIQGAVAPYERARVQQVNADGNRTRFQKGVSTS